jgi:hypothetical protein
MSSILDVHRHWLLRKVMAENTRSISALQAEKQQKAAEIDISGL